MIKLLMTLALLITPLFAGTSLIQAQDDGLHWTYRTNFSRSMTVSTRVSVDGTVCEGTNWECAAFIDDECRYSQLLQYRAKENIWVAYISVQFNQEDAGKLVTFRVYNHETQQESMVTEKLKAVTNANHGLNPPDYDYYLLEASSQVEKLFEQGEGTPESPYLLNNKKDFFTFNRYVTEYSYKVCVKMTSDIDLENEPWTTLGTFTEFTGTLDGDGHTLKNLYIDNSSGGIYAAMFGQLSGTVKNLTIQNGTVIAGKDGNNYAGMIAANLTGTIRNVLCNGEIRSTYSGDNICVTGGIVGYMYSGELTHSAFTGTIVANKLSGGLVGQMGLDKPLFYHIDSCYFYGTITNPSGLAGGLIGHQNSTIGRSNFYNSDQCPYEVYAIIGPASNGPRRVDAGRTTAEFKTGEVAYKMGWGQNLSQVEAYPMPNSNPVYQIKKYKGKEYLLTSYVNQAPEEEQEKNVIYLCESEIPGFTADNIVYKQDGAYYCEHFVLDDTEEFYTPVSFTAKTASYTRLPKVWADGSNGWETIILPFAASRYEASLSGEIVPFWNKTDLGPSTGDNMNKDGKFWIKSHSGSETTSGGSAGKVYFDFLHRTPAMDANLPYIIAIPGEKFGKFSLEGQSITFSATDIEVRATPSVSGILIGDFAFQGTYAPIASKSLVLNAQGNLFTRNSEGSQVGPLHSYFEYYGTYSQKMRSLSIGSGNGGATGLTFAQSDPGTLAAHGEKGCISVETSEALQVNVRTVDGHLILTRDVEPGETRFNNLQQGVYLVNNLKVIVK